MKTFIKIILVLIIPFILSSCSVTYDPVPYTTYNRVVYYQYAPVYRPAPSAWQYRHYYQPVPPLRRPYHGRHRYRR